MRLCRTASTGTGFKPTLERSDLNVDKSDDPLNVFSLLPGERMFQLGTQLGPPFHQLLNLHGKPLGLGVGHRHTLSR
jgi:hypothetical protein